MPPLPNKQDIARLSRDRNFLMNTAVFLTVISIIGALIISSLGFMVDFGPKSSQLEAGSFPKILTQVRNPDLVHSHHLAEDFRFLIPTPESPEARKNPKLSLPKIIAGSGHLNESEKKMLTLLHQGLSRESEREQVIKEFTLLPKNTRYRSEFLGDIHTVAKKSNEALDYYLAEGQAFPDARYSQRSAILELWRMQKFDQLKPLLETENFRNALDAGELMPILTDAQNFPALLVAVLRQSVNQFRFPQLIPPLFAALIWALILLAFTRITKRIVTLSLAAFLLGMFSASLTLFAVMIQNRIQGFDEASCVTPLSQIVYWIAGVGLREETLKLLCFVPIALWILPKKNNLEALILAGMVGLGFACEENFSYFSGGGDTGVVWSRFLTANALHFSLTGIAGFFFFRMLVRKGWGMEDFIAHFLLVVLAHGVYDALIGMPSLQSYSPLGIIALALIAYRYFDQLGDHLDLQSLHRRVSPLGVFVLGSAVLLCSILIFSTGQGSFRHAFGDFALSLGAMIPLAFSFISRFREI